VSVVCIAYNFFHIELLLELDSRRMWDSDPDWDWHWQWLSDSVRL